MENNKRKTPEEYGRENEDIFIDSWSKEDCYIEKDEPTKDLQRTPIGLFLIFIMIIGGFLFMVWLGIRIILYLFS